MDIAVTGATGFIGSHLCKTLLKQGHTVRAFSFRGPQNDAAKEVWESCHRRYIVDLTGTDPNFNGCDRVYHFAADMGGVGFFTANDYWPYIINSRITFRILQGIGFWKVPRSFMAASACAYPTRQQMTEGVAPALAEWMLERGEPDQMYGREKLMMTRLAERHPQDIRVGILHTIYGEGQEHSGERAKFPPAAALKALRARETGTVEMWGNGKQLRSYLHIDDAIRKIIQLTETDTYLGATNIGFDGAISCLEVQQLCNRFAGVPEATITFNDAKPSGVLGRDCCNDRWHNLYGSEALIGYDEGFRRLVDWLDQTGAAWH